MGQKVNPHGFRLGISKKQSANWYAKGKDFSKNLIEDLKVREHLSKKLKNSSISKVELERSADSFVVNIHTARPGIIIGKRGEEIENLKKSIQKIVKGPTQINIKEVRKPDLDAKILAEGVAQQLEKRVMFRRAMKRAMQNAMRLGAQGIKIMSSGRLNGIEIARSEWYREGRVPLHTLRADVDYGTARAQTQYGIIGVKVWIFKGEIFEDPTLPKTASESQVEKKDEFEKPKAKKTIKAAVKKPEPAEEVKKPKVSVKKKDEVEIDSTKTKKDEK